MPDRFRRLLERRSGGHIVRVGKDADIVEGRDLLAGQRVELGDLLDLVAEEADAPRHILIMRRKYLQAVAADAEIAARERLVVALVLERDELSDDLAIVGDLRSEEHTSELQSLMRISYAVFCLNKKHKYEQNKS